MDRADKAVLRLGVGLGLSALIAYGLALPAPFVVCVLTVLLLCKPGPPIPFLKGAVMGFVIAALLVVGVLMVPILENYAVTGVMLTGALLYAVFFAGARSANPLTIFLVIRWQFFGQAVMFGHAKTGREALQDSANAVKGRWWKTLFAVVIFDLIAVLPGILVGLVLLVLGRTAVSFANGVSSFLFSLSIPISVIAMTLLYLDRYKEDEELTKAAAGD